MSSRRPETGNITIAANATTQALPVGPCNYVYCYDQDGLVQVNLYSNRQLIESHIVERLTLLPGKNFDEFTITDLSGSDNTVRFFYGPGNYTPNADRSVVILDDSTPPEVEVGNEVDVNIVGGSVTLNTNSVSVNAVSAPDVSVGAAALVNVIAAASNISRVRVTNPDTSTATLRIGGHNSVGAANGSPLPPGATWETQCRSGVWVYNPGGTAVLVALEVETST